jgi:hypothetical protein
MDESFKAAESVTSERLLLWPFLGGPPAKTRMAYRVDTGNRIVAALNSAPFQVASIYAAEPRESSFTPSGRSSPLGDTCR